MNRTLLPSGGFPHAARIRILALVLGIAAVAAVFAFLALRGSTEAHAGGGAYVAIDLDLSNGAAPCDIIDDTITVNGGDQVQAAVCLVGGDESPFTFTFEVRYDDTVISAPEIPDFDAALDDNPDGNAGATTFGATDLGSNWTCGVGGGPFPVGDDDPATGPEHGLAFLNCRSIDGVITLGGTGVLGVITFDAIGEGSTALALESTEVYNAVLFPIVGCINVPADCFGGTINVEGDAPATATPTSTATPTAVTPTATANPDLDAGVYLDFDITNGANPCDVIDPSTTVVVGTPVQVAVCQIDIPRDLPDPSIGPTVAFNYRIIYDDTVIVAPEVADFGSGLDDNPDANAGLTTFGPTNLGPFWDCHGGVGSYPKGDQDAASGPGHGRAYSGGCGSPKRLYTLGDSGVLSVLTFDSLTVGSTSLIFHSAELTSDELQTLGCNVPAAVVVLPCVGGTIFVEAPPTPTPTPPGPAVYKTPEMANLWICEDKIDTPGNECDGNGEGTLVIEEVATNIAEPLGAWEIQIKFDHKIFNVATDPNEALFTDYGRTPNCGLGVVTENWILFGCVSTGPVGAGFVGPGPVTLAEVILTPNADLKFRLHPGNDNGVVRKILDENCELADALGHPEPGSVSGGLAAGCGDADVTVRILEGDVNVDCVVDVIDQQEIASRYGTFFGNIFYDPWYDLEPALKDFDIDIKDIQKVFGRAGSTCADPVPPQLPVEGKSVGPL